MLQRKVLPLARLENSHVTTKPIMPRLASFFALLAIVVLMGTLFFQVIVTFVLPLFLSLILVVIFRPMYRWFVVKCKGRDRIAAAVTTLVVALIVLAPTLGFLVFAGVEAASVVTGLGDDQVSGVLNKFREFWELKMPQSLLEIEQQAEQLETPAITETQFIKQHAAAKQLTKLIDKKIKEWKLPDPSANPPVGNAPQESDEELVALLAEFDLQLLDLTLLEYGDAGIGAALTTIQETYFTRVRPKLVDRALTEQHTRIWVWLILQANPSRSQIATLRRHAVDWVSSDALGPLAISTGRKVGSFILGLVIMMVALYYFMADGPGMVQAMVRLAPLDRNYVEQLLTEFDKVSRAVVVATLLAAAVQGMLGGVGYWLAGLDSVFLLTMLTAVLALIPFVGATAVWLPCALWLLVIDQRPVAAAMLAVYGVCVVSTVDNVIKPLVLHGQSNIHPLLALLSVLGGVKALGPIGVFVGPMVVAFLQAVLNMLRTELVAMGQQPKNV